MSRILDTGIAFNPAEKRVTFEGIPGFSVRKVVAIINLTRRATIYAFDKPSLGFTASTSTSMTLAYDTAAHNANDLLTVVYGDEGDVPTGTGQASALEQMASVLEAERAQAPARIVFDIAANPAADLVNPTRAIRCEIGGTLLVDMVGGGTNQPLRFRDGETRPVQVKRVRSLGTAAGVEGMA